MLHAQVNQTAQMVFGVPLSIAQTHTYLYNLYGGSLDNDTIKAMVLTQIEDGLVAQGADEQVTALTLAYAEAFYSVWLQYPSLDLAVLGSQIQDVSEAFFPPLGEAGQFALLVGQALTVYDYAAPENQLALTIGLVSNQSGLDAGLLSDIYWLGPAPTLQDAYLFANGLVFDENSSVRELPSLPFFLLSSFVNVIPDPRDGAANNTMLMVVSLAVGGSSDEAGNDVRVIREIVQSNIDVVGEGYSVYVTGDPAVNIDIMDTVKEDTSLIEPVTVILILLLVGSYFRSVISPGVPLMTIGIAYLITLAMIFIVGTYVLEMHYSVLTLVLTVMLGAGTDYCIFMMSRYREERVLGRSKEEAVRTTLMWAGESITTSGMTVMIGFGVLMIGQYSLVRSMGMALVIAVGAALLFALTMLPSLIMLAGDRVFWPNRVKKDVERHRRREERGGGYFRKSAQFSLKHARGIVIAAALVSIPAAYLVLSLESSYDFMGGLPNVESTEGLGSLQEGFGAGKILPTYVVVQFDEVVFANGTLVQGAASDLEEYCALVESIDNVQSVSGPTRPFGTPVTDEFLYGLPELERAEYEAAISGAIGTDNRTALLTVVFVEPPFSRESIHTIDQIRELDGDGSTQLFSRYSAEVYVGGSTAGMADVSRSVADDFSVMRIVAVVGIYLVLMFVLGSLLIPLRLILTVLLNVAWTISATMIVFEFVREVPVLWMMPLILFVVAMGLGMDYDIFLTTRIREEVSKGKTDEEAILTAVERTGGIITACGMVMAGAFGSMMLSGTALLQEFGFALAFAILLDTLLIRIYIVPAVMLLLKKWNWYAPGRLQRVRREQAVRKH
jgi:RND superfamily putative drug exporter